VTGEVVKLDEVVLGQPVVVARRRAPRYAARAKNWQEVQARAAQPPRVLAADQQKRRARASYDGGLNSRTIAQWTISHGNANRELWGTLCAMRARSRDLERNDPFAKKFLSLVEINMVGANGISTQSRAGDYDAAGKFVQDRAANAIIEREWWAFSRTGQFEATGKLCRSAFERLLVRTIARDGEVLVKHISDPESRWGFRVQMLEADWLDETYNEDRNDGTRVIMGVHVAASGKPLGYYLYSRHPGDTLGRSARDRIYYSADVLKHYFIAERPEQVRGVPWMHAAMTRLYQLGEFDESAILAARIGADKVMLLQDKEGMASQMADGALNAEDGSTVDVDDARGGALFFQSQKGSIDILPPGTETAQWDPTYPNDVYGPFVLAALRGVSSGLGVSYESLTNDRNGVTWTSIRHAVLDERDHWRSLQGWLIDSYAQDTYSAWLQRAIIAPQRPLNYLPPGKLGKFMAPQFHGRRWDWVNPKDDIEAKREALRLRLTSHRRVLAEQGLDLEEVLQEIQDDREVAKLYGIDLDDSLRPPAPAGAMPPPAATQQGTNP